MYDRLFSLLCFSLEIIYYMVAHIHYADTSVALTNGKCKFPVPIYLTFSLTL